MSRFLAKEAIFAIICFLCTTTVALFVASIAIQQSRATSVGSFLDQELLDNASLTDSAMDHRAVDWAALKAINPDVIGWIIVEGTAISCPLVKAPREDPDYYLAHDLYGEENRYGCPYLDAACENEFDSTHCVIYGHNMGWDDALFADLQRFTDSDFAQQRTVAYRSEERRVGKEC